MRVTRTKSMGEWRSQERCIKHNSGRFFTLWPNYLNGGAVLEQPEIGCLGLIVIRDETEKDLKLLLQKKREPGTVGDYEYSTTVQATRSNLDGVHGGKGVLYAEYFDNPRNLIHCSLQIEQTDAYFEKCNANIIKVFDTSEVNVVDGYDLLSIQDLNDLLENDSAKVSMDLRSVGALFLGLLKVYGQDLWPKPNDQQSLEIFLSGTIITDLSQAQFFNSKSYNQLLTSCTTPVVISDYGFDFFDVEIEGREVSSWIQPMLTQNTPIFNHLDVFPESGDFIFAPSVVNTLSERWKVFHASGAVNSPKSCVRYNEFFEEGGRFYQVKNFYGINELQNKANGNMVNLRSMLHEYLLRGMSTTIELRSLLFVFLIQGYCKHG